VLASFVLFTFPWIAILKHNVVIEIVYVPPVFPISLLQTFFLFSFIFFSFLFLFFTDDLFV